MMTVEQTQATSGQAVTRPSLRRRVLVPWHVVLASAFLVACLTGDVATFGQIHLYAGGLALAALLLRVAMAVKGGALALPRPALSLSLRRPAGGGRPPALAWTTVLLLLAAPAAAVSGWPAMTSPAAADLHAQLSDWAMGLVGVHAALVLALFAA